MFCNFLNTLKNSSDQQYPLGYLNISRHSPKPPVSITSNAITSGKYKRRNLEAIPASKTRSNSLGGNVIPPTSQPKQGKHPHRNASEGSLSNEFVYPEEWRFHYGKRNAMVDSCSESSSLFSSSDASSCSTTSTKDSGNAADFSDYIFGEMAPNWDTHYGLSSNSVTL